MKINRWWAIVLAVPLLATGCAVSGLTGADAGSGRTQRVKAESEHTVAAKVSFAGEAPEAAEDLLEDPGDERSSGEPIEVVGADVGEGGAVAVEQDGSRHGHAAATAVAADENAERQENEAGANQAREIQVQGVMVRSTYATVRRLAARRRGHRRRRPAVRTGPDDDRSPRPAVPNPVERPGRAPIGVSEGRSWAGCVSPRRGSGW